MHPERYRIFSAPLYDLLQSQLSAGIYRQTLGEVYVQWCRTLHLGPESHALDKWVYIKIACVLALVFGGASTAFPKVHPHLET
jgi:hypothetical protein